MISHPQDRTDNESWRKKRAKAKKFKPAHKRPRYRYPSQRPGQPARRPKKPRRGKAVDPVRSELESLLDLQYGPQFQELEHERAVSGQQQANIQGWYQQYLDELGKAAGRTQGVYQQAQQNVTTQANTAASQDQARMAQNQAEAQQAAAIRGTSAGPATEQASAIGGRQALSSSFGGMLDAHAGAAATLAQGVSGQAAAARLQAQTNERGRLGEIDELVRRLKAERGSEGVKLTQEQRDAERKWKLEQAAFGLDVRQQTATEKKAAKDRRQRERSQRRSAKNTRRGQNVTRRGQNVTDRRLREKEEREAAKDAYQRTHGLGPYKPAAGKKGTPKYTQSQKNAAQENYRRAKTISLKGIPKADWIEYVADTRDIDPLIVRGAILPSSLTAKQRRQLRLMGIRVGGNKRPTRRSFRGDPTGPRAL